MRFKAFIVKKVLFSLRSSGMSLLEVMIAAGLMGGLSLVLSQIMKSQFEAQKTSEIKFDRFQLVNLVQNNLLSKEACNRTFAAAAGVPYPITAPFPLPADLTRVLNKMGDVVVEQGQEYPAPNDSSIPKQFRISQLQLTPGSVSSHVLAMEFENISATYKGAPRKTYNFNLQVQTDNSGMFESCYSDISNTIKTAVQNACEALGGWYDDNGTPNVTSDDLCNLVPFAPPGFTSPAIMQDFLTVPNTYFLSYAASTKFVYDFVESYHLNVARDTYVNISGDTMTGPLNINTGEVPSLNVNNGQLRVADGVYISSDLEVNQNQIVRGMITVGEGANRIEISQGHFSLTSNNMEVLRVNSDGTVEKANQNDATIKLKGGRHLLNYNEIIKMLSDNILTDPGVKEKIISNLLQYSQANSYETLKHAVLSQGFPGKVCGSQNPIVSIGCANVGTPMPACEVECSVALATQDQVDTIMKTMLTAEVDPTVNNDNLQDDHICQATGGQINCDIEKSSVLQPIGLAKFRVQGACSWRSWGAGRRPNCTDENRGGFAYSVFDHDDRRDNYCGCAQDCRCRTSACGCARTNTWGTCTRYKRCRHPDCGCCRREYIRDRGCIRLRYP